MKEGVEIEAERSKVEELKKKYEIEATERENNLLALAAQVQGDKKDAELLQLQRSIQQGQRERELLRGDKFNALQNEAEVAAFLQEQKKAGLLREDELRTFAENIKNGGEDRELARKHLLAKVNSQNAADLEKLQAEIVHVQQKQALDYEAELSSKQFDEQVKQLQRDTEAAKLTFTKTGEEHKIETLNVEHKIALQRLQDKYDDERYDIKKRRERDDQQFDDDRRKRELEWKQKIAADNLKMMAELDAQRRQQKHDAELALKTLDNDSEKAKLLAEKAAAEKLEQERVSMNAQLSAAQDKHAAAFAKSADDIKEIALVLAGAKSGGQTAEQPKEKVILVCPKCKTRNGGDSKFCSGCGEML
ncbi:hypothetical protein FACS18942_10800 [Planctomycetales bacterium]|nr:hypothetical protein FACS18942_10800 [Planctomycetales bacterium]